MEKLPVTINLDEKEYPAHYSKIVDVNVEYCIEFDDEDGFKKFGKEYCFMVNPDGAYITMVFELRFDLINAFLFAIKN